MACALSVRLLLLGLLILRFTDVITFIGHFSISEPYSIPSYATVCFSIHLVRNIWVFPVGAITSKVSVNIYKARLCIEVCFRFSWGST